MPPRLKSVFVVDEDERSRDTLCAILRPEFRVTAVSSGEEALALARREDVDLMLLDVHLPGIGGLELLRIVKENYSLVEIIMISATSEVETAVRAMKNGAYHFVTKDVDREELRSLVRHAAERQDLNRQLIMLNAQVTDAAEREFVLGPSRGMREIVELVQRVAKLSATVLILGESGTGKELLARLIHRDSGRAAHGPFIAVNLSAIPSELVESTLFGHERGSFTGAHRQQLGKFELAASGTLFLDEVGDLRLELQAKLLRAIQEGEIERVGGSHPIKTDFRLIVATNVDLDAAIAEGRFREDLYYRINVIPIRMPPLRERPEDIPELAKFFVKRYRTRFRKQVQGISQEALRLLAAQWWPGNIRELENQIERIVAVTDKPWITEDDLPLEYHLNRLDTQEPQDGEPLFQHAVYAFERNFILRSLEKQGWNVTATARHLGIPLSTLKHKMGRHGIRELMGRIRRA